MDTLLRFAGLVWLLSLTWAAVLIMLEARLARRRTSLPEWLQYETFGAWMRYETTRQDSGHLILSDTARSDQ